MKTKQKIAAVPVDPEALLPEGGRDGEHLFDFRLQRRFNFERARELERGQRRGTGKRGSASQHEQNEQQQRKSSEDMTRERTEHEHLNEDEATSGHTCGFEAGTQTNM